MKTVKHSLNEFLWSHWDDYFDNVSIRYISGRYHINCKKGLWGVQGEDLKTMIKEAGHYFYQYWHDGEYDGTAQQKFFDRLKDETSNP